MLLASNACKIINSCSRASDLHPRCSPKDLATVSLVGFSVRNQFARFEPCKNSVQKYSRDKPPKLIDVIKPSEMCQMHCAIWRWHSSASRLGCLSILPSYSRSRSRVPNTACSYQMLPASLRFSAICFTAQKNSSESSAACPFTSENKPFFLRFPLARNFSSAVTKFLSRDRTSVISPPITTIFLTIE